MHGFEFECAFLRAVDLMNLVVGRRLVDGTEYCVRLIRDFCICTVIVAVSVVSRILEFVGIALGRVGTSWDSNSYFREIGRAMCATPGLMGSTGLPGTRLGALSPGRKWPMREKPKCESGGQARRHPRCRGVSERGMTNPSVATHLLFDPNRISAVLDWY